MEKESEFTDKNILPPPDKRPGRVMGRKLVLDKPVSERPLGYLLDIFKIILIIVPDCEVGILFGRLEIPDDDPEDIENTDAY